MVLLKPKRKVLVHLIIMTIPLEISKLWFPFLLLDKDVAGQPVSLIDFSRIAMFLLLVFSLFLVVFTQKMQHLPYRSFGVPLMLMTTFIISQQFITPAPKTAANELVRLIVHLCVTICVVWSINSIDDLNAIIKTFRWTILGLGIIVLVQILTGKYFWNTTLAGTGRYNAVMSDPNHLARYMAIGFFAWLFQTPPKKFSRRLVHYSILVLCVFTVMVSYSRGTWLVFAGTILYLAIMAPKPYGLRVRIMLFFIIFIMLLGLLLSPFLLQRVETLQNINSAAGARGALILGGLAMFQDHPFFGVGIGGYPIQYVKNYHQYLSYYGEELVLSHTYIITIAAEQGIVGLSILFFFLVQVFGLYHRNRQWLARQKIDPGFLLIIFVGILIIFGCSQTEGRFWEDPYLWIFWALLVATGGIRRRLKLQAMYYPNSGGVQQTTNLLPIL